jgi:hypothetical protein
MIYLLEDNEERIRQFQEAAASIAPKVPIRIWRNAHLMIADLVDALEHASVISLDHDLNPSSTDANDPGTGYEVAKLLQELIPCCPIIIHTSNADRGTWMEGALLTAGWKYERVYPYGDDWIATRWASAVRRLLAREK